MCGIAGYIGFEKKDKSLINRTLSLMKNRGPDSKGFYQSKINNKNLLLLHSRLSIIDLEDRSNQPFRKDDFIIVFNGEIYNYLEIRSSLENEGHKFKTDSDTEVILESYRKSGENCVNQFEGMWAFLIFDIRKKKVFMSRDRFGEKPFYYYHSNEVFCFGSEPKFIFSLLNKKLDIDIQKLTKYLVCGYRSYFKKRDTFFCKLEELEPATNLIMDLNLKKKKYKYWNLKFSPTNLSELNIYERSKELLCESMKIRLRSDVPLAFCLSGGLDSSSLAAITRKTFGRNIHTFSIVDKDPRYDESENIKKITSFLKCNSTIIETSKDNFLERMEKIILYYNAPIPTISYYVHNLLSEKIKENGYSVVISGTGADEIFTGYYDHYSFWLNVMKKNKNFDIYLQERENGYGRYINNPLLKNPLKIIDDDKFRGHLYQGSEYFSDLLLNKIDVSFSEENFSNDCLRNRMMNELLNEIVPAILFSDDLNSMMYSMENRSPFLDSSLVEFLYSVPTKYLIKEGFQKIILRKSVNQILPKSILNSKEKVGFNASIESMLDLQCPKTHDWLMSQNPIFDIITSCLVY